MKLMASILQSSIFLGCKAWVHVLRVACLWLQSNYWPVGGFLFLSFVPVAGEVARGMECTRWPGPALEPPTHTLGTGMGVGLSQVQVDVLRSEGRGVAVKQPVQRLSTALREDVPLS